MNSNYKSFCHITQNFCLNTKFSLINATSEDNLLYKTSSIYKICKISICFVLNITNFLCVTIKRSKQKLT